MRRFKFDGSASQELDQSNQTEAKRRAMSAVLFLALVFMLVSPLRARAGMIGAYAPSLWTLTNTSADGFVTPTASGVEITGGNTGSGNPGTTDFQILAAGTGLVSFSFVYSSLDLPSADYAGYLLGPNFFPLADTSGTSGSQSFTVTFGEYFGFRVGTVDNQFEPGVLDISNFNAPISTVSTGAPEPSTGAIVLAALAFALGIKLRQRRIRQGLTLITRIGVVSLVVIGLGLLGASSLFAQIHFNGSPVTGQLVLINQVNVSQQALQTPQFAVTRLTATRTLGPEVKPNVPARLLQPPAKFKFATTNLQTASPSSSPLMLPMAISNSTSAFSFNGIDHFDQRNANHGNQFSLEPPSQGLAVANGYILEAVNNAFQVYNLSGVPQLASVISTNQLFGLPPEIDRNTGINGPFPTDIQAFWDPDIRRWFVLQRVAANDSAGNPLAQSTIYLAVSQTDIPTGTYNIYSMDTTNASHSGCPCFPDYPQIGADQYGFYISSDEFDFGFQYVDASILAISKASLAAGVARPTAFEFLLPFNTYEFAIHPATTPPGASYFLQNGGVEYFVSSQVANSDTAMAIYAMSNTSSLATATPNLTLTETLVQTLAYSSPPVATQPQGGPIPQGASLGFTFPRPVDGGDTRLQSVIYSGGRLYVTLGTQVIDSSNQLLAGGAYVVISIANRGGQITASALRQGYLLVNGNHLLRPAIAVDAQGRGAIVVTLVGPSYFPSAAMVPFAAFAAGGTLQVVARGTLPDDGFTAYDVPFFGRWGDYAAAVLGGDGRIWMATEYIPNIANNQYPLSGFANWGTSVMAVVPQ
jgi:hypothetical protein